MSKEAEIQEDPPPAIRSRAAAACPGTDQAPPRLQRLAVVIGRLAHEAEDRHLRSQLHALRALVEQEHREAACGPLDTGELARELQSAISDGHEQQAIAVARRLASAERTIVQPVDWNAISGG